MERRKLFALASLMAILIVVLISGCSDKPDAEEAKKIINAELREGIPPPLMGAAYMGKNPRIVTLEILEIGPEKKVETGLLMKTKRTLWPVKLHVSGDAVPTIGPMAGDKRQSFDAITTYSLYRDEQGVWKVAGALFMFQ